MRIVEPDTIIAWSHKGFRLYWRWKSRAPRADPVAYLSPYQSDLAGWLDATGAPIGVQQKLMRHAQIATTMNVYGGALLQSKREANGKVVEMLRPVLEYFQRKSAACWRPLMFPNVLQSQPAGNRKLLIILIAGGGFEPQVRIDST